MEAYGSFHSSKDDAELAKRIAEMFSRSFREFGLGFPFF